MVVGVLALQGGFGAHRDMLSRLDVPSRELRLPGDFEGISSLILPGGESSTMLKLLEREGLFSLIQKLGHSGLPVLGTCAGAILMCQQVMNPSQKSFGFIPACIERNAYGSQRESFETEFPIKAWRLKRVHALFIRAPRWVHVDEDVRVLSTLNDDITGVQYKNFTAVTYHPELTHDHSFHQAWLDHTGQLKK